MSVTGSGSNLTISGGTFTHNGNVSISSTATFNMLGGEFYEDGAGTNNVVSTTALFSIATSNFIFSGGTITIVDPHPTSNSSAYPTFYYSGAATIDASGGTLRFGDGISSASGANTTYGFMYHTGGSNKLRLWNVEVNGGTGTNRFVGLYYPMIAKNLLQINTNSELRTSLDNIFVLKNLTNNGTLTTTSSYGLALGDSEFTAFFCFANNFCSNNSWFRDLSKFYNFTNCKYIRLQ